MNAGQKTINQENMYWAFLRLKLWKWIKKIEDMIVSPLKEIAVYLDGEESMQILTKAAWETIELTLFWLCVATFYPWLPLDLKKKKSSSVAENYRN